MESAYVYRTVGDDGGQKHTSSRNPSKTLGKRAKPTFWGGQKHTSDYGYQETIENHWKNNVFTWWAERSNAPPPLPEPRNPSDAMVKPLENQHFLQNQRMNIVSWWATRVNRLRLSGNHRKPLEKQHFRVVGSHHKAPRVNRFTQFPWLQRMGMHDPDSEWERDHEGKRGRTTLP